LHLARYRKATNIALYVSANGEVDLERVWRTASQHGKYCYFPKLNGEVLSFVHANLATSFSPNKFGILEPDVELSQAISPDKFDLVFMPLVSFDKFGNRLGMGKGYYDKTFADITRHGYRRVHLYGVAYDFQQTTVLPADENDVPLDAIITEGRVHWSRE